jgi:coenzyme F420 hydrogenase subunit beta
MSKDNPLIPEPFIARTKDEIIEASKSKYCPVPLNVILKQIIESDDNEKFAIVGLGCHIQGIRKAQLIMKGLQSKISFCIGIFCSHTDSFLATDYILDWHHIDKDNVSKLDYRGNGWPGSMQIEFKSGSKAEIAYSKYITVHELYLFSPICCSNCIDGISELADISIGDVWGIVSKDKYGKSLCITRSKTGEQMLNDCSQVNNINLTYVGIDKVINSQGLLSRNRLKKARSQLKINRLLGTKSPIYLKADLYLNDFDPAIKNYVQLFIIKVHKKIFEFRCLWPLTYKLLEFEILLMKKLKLKK